jgi:hypothetical protein
MPKQEFIIQEQIEDFEILYHSIPSDKKVILNNLDYLNKEHRDMLPNLVKNTIKDDVVSLIPTCSCKHISGFSNMGAICPLCNTEVVDMFANFEPVLWLKRMGGMPEFISPLFLLELDRVVNIQVVGNDTFSMVRWFSDKQYSPDVKSTSRGVLGIFEKDEDVIRSYQWFVNNIEYIISKIRMFTTTQAKSEKLTLLLEIYRNRRNVIHVNVIPFPHKKFLIHEPNALGNYIQGSIPYLMNAALLFMKYKDYDSVVYKERAIGRVLSFLTKAYINITDTFLAKKEGGFRKNLFGLRGDYNIRAVIVPIPGPHEYDELYLPYKSSCRLFEMHIRNLLYNRMNMTTNHINKLLDLAETEFVQVVYDAMLTLIAEAQNGIRCIFYRNPAQNNASIVRLRITRVKPDIEDDTFSLSPLTMPLMNADVDGDQCNAQLPLDNYMVDLLEPFSPEHTVSTVSANTESIFGKVNIPDTVSMTLTNIIREEKKHASHQG